MMASIVKNETVGKSSDSSDHGSISRNNNSMNNDDTVSLNCLIRYSAYTYGWLNIKT